MAKKPPPKPEPVSRGFKFFITFWAVMENGLFSGLRAGWSALVYILKQENIYAELCTTGSSNEEAGVSVGRDGKMTEISKVKLNPFGVNSFNESGNGSVVKVLDELLLSRLVNRNVWLSKESYPPLMPDKSNDSIEVVMETASFNVSHGENTTAMIGCDAQDAIFNQCFTIATAAMALSALLYGHLNYKFGLRAPRILSVLIFMSGTMCFAFVSEDVPWLIFPGLLLVSSGGMALYITNNQISYLFTVGSAAVVGLLCGALEASSFIQTVIKIAYENGISLQVSYLTLTGLYSLTMISTIFLLPKDYITNVKIEDIEMPERETDENKNSASQQRMTTTTKTAAVENGVSFGKYSRPSSSTSIELTTIKVKFDPVDNICMSNNTNIDDKSEGTDAGRRDIAIDPPSFKDLPNTSASQANVYNEMKGDSSTNKGHSGERSSDSKFLESDPSIDGIKSVNVDSNLTKDLENNIAHPTSNGFLDSGSQSPADHNQEDTTTFTNDKVPIDCTSANMDAEHNISNNAKSLPMYTQSSNSDDPSKSQDPQDSHHVPKDQLQAKEVKTLMTFSNNHISESTFGNKGGAEENHVTTSSQSLSSLKGVGGNKTLWQCILSRTFALYLFWAVVVQIVLSMSLGSFNAWLTFVTKNDDSEISKYTDVLFYSMLGSPLLALTIGVGMDAMKRVKTKDRNAINRRTLHTAVMSLGVTSVLSLVVCAMFMSCDRDTIVVTSIALVVFRTGLYSCGTAFLRIMYPTQYFGMLCGIMTVLAGGLSFLQYPLFLWVQLRDSAWAEAFGFLGILGLLSLSQPAYLYWKSRQFKQTLDTV